MKLSKLSATDYTTLKITSILRTVERQKHEKDRARAEGSIRYRVPRIDKWSAESNTTDRSRASESRPPACGSTIGTTTRMRTRCRPRKNCSPTSEQASFFGATSHRFNVVTTSRRRTAACCSNCRRDSFRPRFSDDDDSLFPRPPFLTQPSNACLFFPNASPSPREFVTLPTRYLPTIAAAATDDFHSPCTDHANRVFASDGGTREIYERIFLNDPRQSYCYREHLEERFYLNEKQLDKEQLDGERLF